MSCQHAAVLSLILPHSCWLFLSIATIGIDCTTNCDGLAIGVGHLCWPYQSSTQRSSEISVKQTAPRSIAQIVVDGERSVACSRSPGTAYIEV